MSDRLKHVFNYLVKEVSPMVVNKHSAKGDLSNCTPYDLDCNGLSSAKSKIKFVNKALTVRVSSIESQLEIMKTLTKGLSESDPLLACLSAIEEDINKIGNL